MGAPEQEEGECGAFVKRRKGAAATDVSMELDFLDCPVCFHPLRPPIYQCAVGHVVCSSCRAKLSDKCHCCSLATGYNRCHIIEHVVDSTKVPCCYDNFGCTEKITYYEKENHEKVCHHAPCFCPESGCNFTGSIPMLLSHFSVGSTALQGEDGQLFLVNMVLEPVGGLISVFCIQPHITGSNFKCKLAVSGPEMSYSQCAVGHLICSACRAKLKDNKCLLCKRPCSERCFGMECVVDSILVPCPFAEHGCTQQIAYYKKESHAKACVHARCFCPQPGCNFAGSVAGLLAHLTAAAAATGGGQKLPSKAFRFHEPFDLRAIPGMHVLHSKDESHVFLLTVTPSPPLGHAVSLVSVQPDGAAEPGKGRCPAALEAVVYSKFGCSVLLSCFPGHHQIATMDRVRCSSLAHGPPADFFCVVPMVPEEGDGRRRRHAQLPTIAFLPACRLPVIAFIPAGVMALLPAGARPHTPPAYSPPVPVPAQDASRPPVPAQGTSRSRPSPIEPAQGAAASP
ncbi:hypothetical protein PR202_ga23639 [Eleusine coracana subsp. coracana]|uniref:RING-type E3 ubiquitin transferase n=1 Tax=Eleusine coracana subsp. coracana TaxID=191504 RepID=A0AAV5D6C6_ELECO|nr:hypothetical protein PR202_ga23639 [Eleusine coracana subsp. coracana]